MRDGGCGKWRGGWDESRSSTDRIDTHSTKEWYALPLMRFYLILNDHHSYAETSDTDPRVEITEKYALAAHPPLAWITSDMEKISSRKVIRSQIMLDYRHKHRLAQSRLRRMPAADLGPLVARQPSRASDSSYEPNCSPVAKREKHQTQNKNLEAPENCNLNDVDLYMENMNLKYSQITWPHLDEWSTFTTLHSPVSLRMRGHLHYCKFDRYYVQRRNPVTASIEISTYQIIVVIPPQALWLTLSMKVVNVIVASQRIIRSGAVVGLQEFWPTLAQSNPDLLHAIIATSASNKAARDAEVTCGDLQDLLQENNLHPNYTDYLFHQAEAIRLINGKLSDPAQACSDATLGAVTLLMCSNVSCTILCL